MRPTVLLLLAALVLPAAAAMPGFSDTWSGPASTSLFLPDATLCQDEGDAVLLVEYEMETATFVLHVDAECVRDLAFRAILGPEGWEFVDATGSVSGGFYPTDDPGVWRLDALVDTCPPFAICEFASGIRAQGVFHRGPAIL